MQIGEGDLGLQQGNVDIVLREPVQPTPAYVVHFSFYEARHSQQIPGTKLYQYTSLRLLRVRLPAHVTRHTTRPNTHGTKLASILLF